MKYLPLFHNLRGSRVLVVGGGEIALRKSRLLADAGALLRVVAPEIETQLRELVAASGGECLLRGYVEADLDGCGLIIAATDDEALAAMASLAGSTTVALPAKWPSAPLLGSNARVNPDGRRELFDLRHARDLAALERDWLAPLHEDILAGRLQRATLDFADGHMFVLTAGQRWRLWRRALGALDA